MNIEVMGDRCIGAGNCAEAAGKYFDQDDADGTVVVKNPSIEPGDENLVKRAVTLCPVGALVLLSD